MSHKVWKNGGAERRFLRYLRKPSGEGGGLIQPPCAGEGKVTFVTQNVKKMTLCDTGKSEVLRVFFF